ADGRRRRGGHQDRADLRHPRGGRPQPRDGPVQRVVRPHRPRGRRRLLRPRRVGGGRHVRPRPAGRGTRPHPGQDRRGAEEAQLLRRARRGGQHRPGGQVGAHLLPHRARGGRTVGEEAPRRGVRLLTEVLHRLRGDRRLLAGVAVTAVAVLWLLVRAYGAAGDGGTFLQFTIFGITAGCVFAVTASGLVLTYTTTGVFNFAHGAVGMLCAFVHHQLTVEWGAPVVVSLVVVLGVLAPLVGLTLERMMRSFRGASPGTTLTVTIALTVLLIGVAQYGFQSDGGQRTLPPLLGDRYVVL